METNTNQVTLDVNGQTMNFVLGQTFVNGNKTGRLVKKEKGFGVEFELNGKQHTSFKLDNWQAVGNEDQGAKETMKDEKEIRKQVEVDNLLGEILDNFEPKKELEIDGPGDDTFLPEKPLVEAENVKDGASETKDKGEKSSVISLPMTKDEKKVLKALEKEYEKVERQRQSALQLVEKLPFTQAKILNKIRNGKLYRETINQRALNEDGTLKGVFCKTFGEYCLSQFNIVRGYGQQLALIGNFAEHCQEFFEVEDTQVELGVKAATHLVNNQTKLAGKLGLENDLGNFKPLLEQIIDLNVKAARNDETGISRITEKVVNKVAEKVSDEIGAMETVSLDEIIQTATNRLKEKGRAIIELTRKELSEKPKAHQPIVCESHTVEAAKIAKFENGVITLECGHTFRIFQA